MDIKNVRILKAPSETAEGTIMVDNATRKSLIADWGDRISLLGRRKGEAVIQPLDELDSGVQVARISEDLMKTLFIEYGEEVLLLEKV